MAAGFLWTERLSLYVVSSVSLPSTTDYLILYFIILLII